jgi:hypothetical protein
MTVLKRYSGGIMKSLKAGDTVDLTGCRAYPEASPKDEVILDGEYILEEFQPYDPGAFVHEPGWVVIPLDGVGLGDGYFVPLPNVEDDEVDPENETTLYLSSDELRILRKALGAATTNYYLRNNTSEGNRCSELSYRIEDFCAREPLALAKIESGIIKVEQETRG